MRGTFLICLFAFLGSIQLAQAMTAINGRSQPELIFGATSEDNPNVKFAIEEGKVPMLFLDGSGDLRLGYANDELLRTNVRGYLARFVVKQGPLGPADIRIYLVVPLVGDLRIRPGGNELGKDLNHNLSISTTWGGVGAELVKDITGFIQIAARGEVAHHQISESLPEGKYTEEGARQMRRTDGNRFVLDTIDANGVKTRFQFTADLANMVLLGLQAQAAWIAQNGVQYYDHDGDVFLKIRMLNVGPVRFSVYGDYYLHVTDLTDRGHQRTFQLVSGGLSAGW